MLPVTTSSTALACALLLAACGTDPDLGTMQIDSVHRSLVADEGAWDVQREHPDHPVHATVLQPRKQTNQDSIAAPSLELVPPARVRLDLAEAPRDATLHLRVGLDRFAYEGEAEASVAFRVRAGDEVLFEEEKRFGSAVPTGDRVWTRAQLPIVGGDAWTLETDLLGGGDATPSAGFAALEVATKREVPRRPATPEHPSVVFVVMDTLRADRLSCYGYERKLTPYLDALAADGTLFEFAYSASSWTWPSTASLLTGLAPPAHGLVDPESCFLSHELLTVAEQLQNHGWTTGGFSTNPLIRSDTDFDQGFETFESFEMTPTREVWNEIEAWIAAQGERRYFLYLQLVDPHEYLPDPELLETWSGEEPEDFDPALWRALERNKLTGREYDQELFARYTDYYSSVYDATVAEADEFVGRLREALAREGHADTTVIAFTSDHGEEFLEHGQILHAKQLYEESLRIPLILAGRGVPAGRRVETRVENRFVAPSLLALAGVEPRGNLEGFDLLDETDLREARDTPVFASTELGRWFARDGTPLVRRTALHSVRHDGWLYIWNPEPPEGGDGERLFHLERDPGALEEVSAEHPTRCEAMRGWIVDWLERGAAQRPGGMSGGATSIEFLKDLGYIGGADD